VVVVVEAVEPGVGVGILGTKVAMTLVDEEEGDAVTANEVVEMVSRLSLLSDLSGL